MTKILKFAKLDFTCIMPSLTWKNLLICAAITIFVGVTARSAYGIQGAVTMFGVMIVSYPFAYADKDGLDLLYGSLAIGRKEVVFGRYTFTFLLDCVIAVAAFVAALIMDGLLFMAKTGADGVYQKAEIGSILLIMVASVIFMFFVQITQIPLYFKLGYNKARMLVFIPLFVSVMLFTVVLNMMLRNVQGQQQLQKLLDWLTVQNILLVLAMAAGVLVLCTLVSVALSLKFYKKREF